MAGKSPERLIQERGERAQSVWKLIAGDFDVDDTNVVGLHGCSVESLVALVDKGALTGASIFGREPGSSTQPGTIFFAAIPRICLGHGCEASYGEGIRWTR
jgi:hypothetical protein